MIKCCYAFNLTVKKLKLNRIMFTRPLPFYLQQYTNE